MKEAFAREADLSDLPLRACARACACACACGCEILCVPACAYACVPVPVPVPVPVHVLVLVPVPVPVALRAVPVPDLHLPIHSTRFRPLMDIQRNISEIFATAIFHCQDVFRITTLIFQLVISRTIFLVKIFKVVKNINCL